MLVLCHVLHSDDWILLIVFATLYDQKAESVILQDEFWEYIGKVNMDHLFDIF